MGISVDGIPVPVRTDAADAPAQLLAMAEAIDLRLDTVDGQADTSIASLASRVTTLEGKMTALQTSTGQTQTDLDALELAFGNIVSWTNLGTRRIEVGTIVQTSDSRGLFVITFRQPFKTVPRVLLVSGSAFALSSASGSGWNTGIPPGPWVHDNSYNNWTTEQLSPSAITCGGVMANAMFRMNYVAFGESKYTDRSASAGGPGFDFQ